MPSGVHAKPYLAFDLGAESGRAVLAHLQSGILTTEEVHRFANEPVEYGGSLHWDVARLWLEMRKALTRLEAVALEGIGVDAWGVDYALLGERGELLQNPYHYRNRRTEGVMEEVLRKVPREEIYQATGIQFMQINTLYQLFAAQRKDRGVVDAAKQLLTIPDLFHYWLSGKAVCEFTNATTTQMVDPVKRSWATSLMRRLDLPVNLPAPLVEPGSILGTLLPAIAGQSALSGTAIIAPACHDTGSAVAAISARAGTAFLSSGTWSLLGTELDAPVITSDALDLGFVLGIRSVLTFPGALPFPFVPLDDVVGVGVVFLVPVDVAPVRFDLVVPSRDGPVVRPDAIHFCGLIDRDSEVRHKANHTSKPYNRSTTARNTMETKVMAERVGFEPTLPFRVNTLSKRAPSATRPSLRL